MRFNVAKSAVTCLACGLFLGGALMLASCEPAHITPPLSISWRAAWTRGIVLQITNRHSSHLDCKVYAISADRQKTSSTYRCIIKSGEMQEIGFLELDGWYLDPGEKIVISVSGYAMDMQVTWDDSGVYYGIYVP